MYAIHAFRALSRADRQGMLRDPLLRGLLIVPLGLAIAARWIFPTMIGRIGDLLAIDLLALYPQIAGAVLTLLPPVITGAVVGFLLLDQRDERTLLALRVTPLPLSMFLAYRLAAPMILSLLMTIITLLAAGVAPSLFAILTVALASAPLAPMLALFFGVFAENKVQGFALQKGMGLVMMAPLAALFLPPDWDLLLGIAPTYWPAALLWQAQAGDPHLMTMLIGLVYHGILLALLLRKLERLAT